MGEWDYVQRDIWGNEHKPSVEIKPSKRFKTMQELYGIKKGHICGTCRHHTRYEYHGRYYHKCLLWKLSNSAATDIRISAAACMKWEKDK